MTQKTITINGRRYDVHTGMPVDEPEVQASHISSSPKHTPLHHSKTIHAIPQKSQTLNRRVVKKASSTPKNTLRSDIVKSSSITKFAPSPNPTKPKPMNDVGPQQHPSLTAAHKKMQAQKHRDAPQPVIHKPSHVIKTEAIKDALDKSPSKTDKPSKQKMARKMPRFASIASAAFALLLLGGYFTYLNMPNLSVRVAAAQAGINARYPEYRPDGYGLKGPIGYTDGQVTMKFAANAGPQNYTVTQAKSSWDSSAVLDNYVKEKAGDNYLTYNERGLTIYTFDGSAAWVNGGILYTINGDAPLSSDQIRRIAVSM